jgi:protease II
LACSTRPPLLVKCHGGPTSAASSTLNLGVQYWTSRGIAVLDVNYRGSTGFGRAYRDRLQLNWGVVDVDDCVAGARFLTAQGRVDGKRCVISGGSAGVVITEGATGPAALIHNQNKNLEVLALEGQRLVLYWRCAPKARITSGGRIHPESCRLIW